MWYKKSKEHASGEKQVNFYLWALSKYTGVAHKKGFVLVDDKNDQEIKVVPVVYDKEKVVPYVNRLKNIQKYKKKFIEENKVPSRKFDSPDHKKCSKCNMRDACWNIGIGRIRLTKEEMESGGNG